MYYDGPHPTCPKCDSLLNVIRPSPGLLYVFCCRESTNENCKNCDYGHDNKKLSAETHEEEYLETRIKAKIAEKDRRQEVYRESMDVLKTEIKNLLRQKKASELGEPDVSDHAALRYLERFKDLDVKDLKEEILTDEVRALIKANPSGQHGVRFEGKKFRIRVDGNVIVTIIPGWDSPKPKNKKPKKRKNERYN